MSARCKASIDGLWIRRAGRVAALLIAALSIATPVGATPAAVKATAAKSTTKPKALLWEIRGAKTTAYLFGSLHMATAAMYPLAPQFEAAFKRSRVLVLEARPDDQSQAVQQQVLKHGMYQLPDQLPKHVSAATWKATQAEAQKLGLPALAVQQMRPWMAAMTLTLMHLKRLGFDEKRGIEMHLLGRHRGPVKELEGAEAQIKLLSSFSAREQELFLLYSIEEASSLAAQMAQIVRVWKNGDGEGLAKLLTTAVNKHPQFKSVYRRLIFDRNRTMAVRIDGMIKSSREVHMVVVGAAHLIGRQGLVALLKKRGYRLRQL